MSAFREERGSRTGVWNAEPQNVGLAPQTILVTERANTMKTYLLRDPNAVEPQKAARPHPPTSASQPPPVAPPGPTLFVGLDVHTGSIAVSLVPCDSTEARRYGRLSSRCGNNPRDAGVARIISFRAISCL